jgi:hypothetical protein
MSLAIYKYEIPMGDDGSGFVAMPKGARILHCQDQCGRICIWAVVDLTEKETKSRHFVVLGTGHLFDESNWPHMHHIATFLTASFVWHVFEWV